MIRFMDSFDHYSIAQITRKWTSVSAGVTIATGQGRNGTDALAFNNQNQFASISLGAESIWNFHFAVRPTAGGITFEGTDLCVLWDNNVPNIALEYRSDGLIGVWRGGIVSFQQNTHAQLIGVCDPPAIVIGGLYHVQFRVVHHATLGSIVIKINDVEVFNVSGIRTINVNNVNEYSTRLTLRKQDFNVPAAPMYFDDVIIADGNGGVNDNLLGDVRITAVLPDADTADKDYARSAGADNYALVDENPANDDADYVESAVVGDKDMYHYTLGAIGDVIGVQTCATDRKTDGGTRHIRHNLRFGVGPTELNGQLYGPATSYLINRNVYDTDIEGDTEVEAGPEILA